MKVNCFPPWDLVAVTDLGNGRDNAVMICPIVHSPGPVGGAIGSGVGVGITVKGACFGLICTGAFMIC